MTRLWCALVVLAVACTAPAPTIREPPGVAPRGAAPVAADQGAGGWEALPDAPIAGRTGHVAVWTGEEMVVWGGYGDQLNEADQLYLVDGAAYDPAADSWRRIADGPIVPSFSHRAVWSGREMLVVALQGGSGTPVDSAAYDVAADSWRRLPDPPEPGVEAVGHAWTGQELLVWGTDRSGRVLVQAYDPAADRWRVAAAAPVPSARYFVQGTWTGGRLVLWGGQDAEAYDGIGCADPFCNTQIPVTFAEVVAYDPAGDAWTALPDAPEEVRTARVQAWTGEAVLASSLSPTPRLFSYDPFAGSAQVAVEFPIGQPLELSAWTGNELLSLELRVEGRPGDLAGGTRFMPEGQRVEPLPRVELEATRDPALVWADDRLLVWGGSDFSEMSSGGEAAIAVASGAAFLPTGQPSPPPEAAFSVRATAQVSAGAPFAVSVGGPVDLPLPGYAELPVTLAAAPGRAVQLGTATGQVALARDGGVLIVLGPAGAQGPPGGDGQDFTASFLDSPLLSSDARVVAEFTLAAQAAPYSPVPGEYHLELAVPWWDALPPGEPYTQDPRSTATITLIFMLEGLTLAAQVAGPEQRRVQEVLETPMCDDPTLDLATGDPLTQDGAVAMQTGAYGWFGNGAYNSRVIIWNPPGDLEALSGVDDSYLLVDGRDGRLCPDGTTGTVVEADPQHIVTTGRFPQVDVELEQLLTGGPEPVLTQRYLLTNHGRDRAVLPIVRHVQGAALTSGFSGGEGRSTAGATRDGSVLYGFTGADPAGSTVYVAVAGDLGGDPTPDRWSVTGPRFEPYEQAGGESGVVEDDGDGDRISDAIAELRTGGPGALTLDQQWNVSLAPGEHVVLTLTTSLGIGVPRDLVAAGEAAG